MADVGVADGIYRRVVGGGGEGDGGDVDGIIIKNVGATIAGEVDLVGGEVVCSLLKISEGGGIIGYITD